MHPDNEPLNKSITENLFLMKILMANDAITLQHIDKIVFMMTIDF